MSNFRPVDRDTGFLMPPSVDEWLPERHLARFVVEVIEGLDLRAMIGSYRGCGEAPYHPTILLGILVYGYATGVFSSRKLERATYDSVAFRFIAANQHPDHDTIAAFRRRFLPRIEATCRTACRSPRSWPAASSAWRRSPGLGRSSRPGRRSGTPASRPSTRPRWRRVRPRPRRPAKSPGAGHPCRRSRDLARPIRST